MTHVLKKDEACRWQETKRPFAAVVAAVVPGSRGKMLRLGDIEFLRAGEKVAPLPERFSVVGPDDVELENRDGLYITVETLDPYHLVIASPNGLAFRPLEEAP